MSGGITQLVAIGAQDAYLTGNPEVSFFRSSYKRHTNFAQTVERQVIQGNVNNNAMSSIRIERKGDLVNYMFLTLSKVVGGVTQSVIPSSAGAAVTWSNLISSVQLLIGGQIIDEQYVNFSSNICPNLFAQNLSKSNSSSGVVNPGNDLIYPFRFFFCENWQSSIPLVALQYHDVEIRIYWGPEASNFGFIWNSYANFTYLDNDERMDFANKPQNMLIYQTQRVLATQSKVLDMAFNQPVKYLCAYAVNSWNGTAFDATSNVSNTALFSSMNNLKLQLNGTDIADYKLASPHFTTVPAYYHTTFSNNTDSTLFVFPFCLDTSKLQPTGSLNFSRLDSARFISQQNIIVNDVYAVNYNILRIQNGMGGLMYAN